MKNPLLRSPWRRAGTTRTPARTSASRTAFGRGICWRVALALLAFSAFQPFSFSTAHAATRLGDLAWQEDVSNNTARISTIAAYLEGDDARILFTNDARRAWMPSYSYQVKTGGVWQVIYDEAEVAARNQAELAEAFAALDDKADRAWGYYDSHTGEYAPDGYTWLSSPKVAVAGGLNWQRTITSDGEIWVLCSNGLTAETAANTNGYFRITDGDGNTQFEIVRGDKRTVGANPTNITTFVSGGVTGIRLSYNIVAVAPPKLAICADLSTQNWKTEDDAECLANVAWSGSSGNYVATVVPYVAQRSLFVKGSYEVGSENIINNALPVKMEYIYLGTKKYRLGTATISGSTVLTLTESL